MAGKCCAMYSFICGCINNSTMKIPVAVGHRPAAIRAAPARRSSGVVIVQDVREEVIRVQAGW